jgi:hypothetical protein
MDPINDRRSALLEATAARLRGRSSLSPSIEVILFGGSASKVPPSSPVYSASPFRRVPSHRTITPPPPPLTSEELAELIGEISIIDDVAQTQFELLSKYAREGKGEKPVIQEALGKLLPKEKRIGAISKLPLNPELATQVACIAFNLNTVIQAFQNPTISAHYCRNPKS